MATQDPTRLPAAVEMLQNQHLQAREYVLNTLKYPAGNPDFGRAVVDVMLVLATNELTLTQKRSK